MKPAPILSVVLGLLGLALFTCLLVSGHLSEGTYLGALAVLGLVCVAVPCIPRLRELDLMNLRMTLSELKQVKADIEEMYGGIENLRKAPLVLDESKMKSLGLRVGHLATADAGMRYTAGCIKRERERLARVFVAAKTPEKLAAAILDNSLDDEVFKWNGPEAPLEAPPISVEEREQNKRNAPNQSS